MINARISLFVACYVLPFDRSDFLRVILLLFIGVSHDPLMVDSMVSIRSEFLIRQDEIHVRCHCLPWRSDFLPEFGEATLVVHVLSNGMRVFECIGGIV